MKSSVVLFALAFIVWCILTWVPDTQHLVAGVFVAAFVAYMTGDLFVERPRLLRYFHRYWTFCFVFLPLFLWECLKANLDVAYRVLHPSLPIRPGIVKVKTDLKSDTALTFLANSVTLTPGTMTVDVDKEQGILYIHWIDVKATDVESAGRVITSRFERVLKRIFD